MKYLGCISGTGVLLSDGAAYGDATYEFEGFLRNKNQVFGSGEIGLKSGFADGAIASKNLQLQTSGGQVLDLIVTDTESSTPDRIWVDISGNVPAESDWHR